MAANFVFSIMPRLNNKIKAFILLLVFALNTVVSFACSVGLVNFNKDHHDQASSSPHSHDKPHSHDYAKPHSHEGVSSHNHTTKNAEHHNDKEDDEKNCCSDEVIKIAESDKTITKTGTIPQPLSVELFATIYTFILGDHYAAISLVKSAPPFVRSWHPTTISDLRIAIQSFQI